jgi:hypothetical protein
MNAKVVPTAAGRFTARVTYFDTFNDGRKVTLNLEAHAVSSAAKTYLTLLISPQATGAPIWQTLREIEAKFHFPEP